MIEKIILIAIFLFPYQSLALKIAGSRYDLTAFILIILVYLGFLFGKLRIRGSNFLGICVFFTYQIAVFLLMKIPPLPRFLSGIIWFGSLLVIVVFSTSIRFFYRQEKLPNIIIVTLSISMVHALLQKFAFGAIRPQAWFSEPSYAGLAFSGLSAASLCILLSGLKISISRKMFFLLLFAISSYSLYLTLSIHFFTLVITVTMFLISKNFGRISVFLSKGIFALPVIIPTLIGVVNYLLSIPHYAERLNFQGETAGLSTLSWLRGGDQTLAAILVSPIGVGLGGTGHFEYFSENTINLARAGIENLNYNDAYSLLFRMIIEMGLPFVILCMFLFCRKLFMFHKFLGTVTYHQSETQHNLYKIFNFVFSTTLVIGCLIKEPLYPNSILYTGVFIFSSTVLNKQESRAS
jgi:hypothetical protein